LAIGSSESIGKLGKQFLFLKISQKLASFKEFEEPKLLGAERFTFGIEFSAIFLILNRLPPFY